MRQQSPNFNLSKSKFYLPKCFYGDQSMYKNNNKMLQKNIMLYDIKQIQQINSNKFIQKLEQEKNYNKNEVEKRENLVIKLERDAKINQVFYMNQIDIQDWMIKIHKYLLNLYFQEQRNLQLLQQTFYLYKLDKGLIRNHSSQYKIEIIKKNNLMKQLQIYKFINKIKDNKEQKNKSQNNIDKRYNFKLKSKIMNNKISLE